MKIFVLYNELIALKKETKTCTTTLPEYNHELQQQDKESSKGLLSRGSNQ